MRVANLVAAIVLLASDCMIFGGRCLYEIRGIEADGKINQNGVELAAGHLTLSEQRDLDPNKSLYWLLTGPTLKSHVTSARLTDAANSSQTLLDLPLADASQEKLSEGGADQRAGADLNAFWDLLSANRVVFELHTDDPARPTITLPVTVTGKQDWTRPYCS